MAYWDVCCDKIKEKEGFLDDGGAGGGTSARAGGGGEKGSKEGRDRIR